MQTAGLAVKAAEPWYRALNRRQLTTLIVANLGADSYRLPLLS
jgi:hypothetical protein